MEVQLLFRLIKSLTCQSSIRGLIAAFRIIIRDNFNQLSFNAYELQPTRIDSKKTSSVICLDCELIKPPFLISSHPLLERSAVNAEAVIAGEEQHSRHIIFPVILYDKSISHLITVEHNYTDAATPELIIGLLEIFSDIFRNIHEKGYDPLTRILNRQAFDQTAAELAYSPLNGGPGKDFKAIAILDIDRFKEINDAFGHAIGDETLVLFAQTIRSVLRQEDLFFRYGGEEFVIFVKDVEHEQAQQVLERCRHAIENRRFPQVGTVTVSIGFTNLENHFHPVENLSKADKALYFIKQNGRNKVLSYEQLINGGLLEPVIFKEGSADFWD
jgi:diguanylate cyclase (GGDEF)-like protein